MSVLRRVSVSPVTDASGDFTSYTDSVSGFLQEVVYVPDGVTAWDTGADVTITEEDTGKALLTITNIGTATLVWHPRIGVVPVANTAGGTLIAGNATTGGKGLAMSNLAVVGRIKVVSANGTASTAGVTGTFYFSVSR